MTPTATFTLLLTPVLQAKAIIKVFVGKKSSQVKSYHPQQSGKKHVMLKYMNYSTHIHTKGYYIFQKRLTGIL